MRPVQVGLSGIGRIGKNVFRLLYARDDIRVAAISDVVAHAALEYLIRFDTIFGRFPDELSIREGNLFVRGRQIPVLDGAEEAGVRWGEHGVEVVVEATGRPLCRAEIERHLENGAQRVILCAPPLEPPDITVVMGVNDAELRPQHRIISNSSCTAHCASPIVKILHQAFGIEQAFLSTVHAYTNQQRLADVPMADPRRGRAAAENIIPQETNAAEMVASLLPELRGRITGRAFNVPVPNGSVVDLVCWHQERVTRTAVNEVVRTAAAAQWRGIVDYEDDPVVSSDIERSPYSSTFDSLATMVLGDNLSKTLSWYDNGWGYANRVVDLIQRIRDYGQEEAA